MQRQVAALGQVVLTGASGDNVIHVSPPTTVVEMREYYPGMDYTPPERADPFMDLRVVEFILSLPVLPWLHKKYR